MKRRSLIKAFTLSASIAAMGMTWTVQAAETIKVGILHSLSGTMAISETSLKDMALMTIDEINAKRRERQLEREMMIAKQDDGIVVFKQ